MKFHSLIKVLLVTISAFFLYSFFRAFRFAPSFSEVICFSLMISACAAFIFFRMYGFKKNQISIGLGFILAMAFHHFPTSTDQFDPKILKFQRGAYLYSGTRCVENVLKSDAKGNFEGNERSIYLVTFGIEGRIVSVDEYSAVRSIPPKFINSRLLDIRDGVAGLYAYIQCEPKKGL